MPQYSTRKELKFIDNGTVDWNPVRKNFENLYKDMKVNADEIRQLSQQTWTVTKMFETDGNHEIMATGKHVNCHVVNAFCTLGDNVDKDVYIRFLDYELKLGKSESAGKTREIKVPALHIIPFWDAVEVKQIGDRRIIYHFTFESELEKIEDKTL